MAVSRKPKTDVTPPADDQALKAYIHSGGSTAKTKPPPTAPEIRQSVSIPGRICHDLDTLRQARPIKTSRSRWILEAIIEKIERDTSD